MEINRIEQCTNNHGGVSELYIFEYVNHARYLVNVTNNILNKFPDTTIYSLNANQVSFSENADTEDGGSVYSQNGSFQLKKVLPTDNYKVFLEKDWSIIVKDNNGFYRLIGLETGLKIKFNKEIGTNLNDFNGFKFSFDTKEENTAPFLNDLEGFDVFGHLQFSLQYEI